MGDERLQELERVWRASGSRQDEGAYLRERVRVGELDPMRLELAATCGHPGAAEALGREPATDSQWPEALVGWEPAGPLIVVRLCLKAVVDRPEFEASSLAKPVNACRFTHQDLSDLLPLLQPAVDAYVETQEFEFAACVRDAREAISFYLAGTHRRLTYFLRPWDRERVAELLLSGQ